MDALVCSTPDPCMIALSYGKGKAIWALEQMRWPAGCAWTVPTVSVNRPAGSDVLMLHRRILRIVRPSHSTLSTPGKPLQGAPVCADYLCAGQAACCVGNLSA